jgi:hypothetical protein
MQYLLLPLHDGRLHDGDRQKSDDIRTRWRALTSTCRVDASCVRVLTSLRDVGASLTIGRRKDLAVWHSIGLQ